MATAVLKTITGESRGTVSLDDALFGIRPNKHVVWETVRARLANQRLGTHKVKHRDEVSGGGTKPWRQKGTGRARSGSNTSPLWVRGGAAHGPTPRNYRIEIPKKIRRLALRSALSDRARGERIIVIESLALTEPKTREVAGLLKGLDLTGRSCLVVLGQYDEAVVRASRNIQRLGIRVWRELSAYDVVRHEWLVITKDALAAMQESAALAGAAKEGAE